MTNEDKKKIYQQLAAAFPEEAIERTDGRVTGRGYSTTGIKYQYVVNRLNEVLGLGNWRTHREISTREITTTKGRAAFEATCDLILELGTWTDGKFVVWAEALADGGHTSTSLADSKKGSFTNALKKAAAMFGCGRQAYEGSIDDDATPADYVEQPRNTVTTVPTQRMPPAAPVATPAAQPSRATAPARNRLSSKQLAAIWAIGRKLGYEQSALRQHVKAAFGVQPEFLTRDQASQAIGALSKQAGNGHADEYQGREVGQEG